MVPTFYAGRNRLQSAKMLDRSRDFLLPFYIVLIAGVLMTALLDQRFCIRA
jgi:hypothetical protein